MSALAEDYFGKDSSSKLEPTYLIPSLPNRADDLNKDNEPTYLGSSAKDKVHDDNKNGDEFYFDSAVLTQVQFENILPLCFNNLLLSK